MRLLSLGYHKPEWQPVRIDQTVPEAAGPLRFSSNSLFVWIGFFYSGLHQWPPFLPFRLPCQFGFSAVCIKALLSRQNTESMRPYVMVQIFTGGPLLQQAELILVFDIAEAGTDLLDFLKANRLCN